MPVNSPDIVAQPPPKEALQNQPRPPEIQKPEPLGSPEGAIIEVIDQNKNSEGVVENPDSILESLADFPTTNGDEQLRSYETENHVEKPKPPEPTPSGEQKVKTLEEILKDEVEAEEQEFDESVTKLKDLLAPADASVVISQSESERPPTSEELRVQIDNLNQLVDNTLSQQAQKGLVANTNKIVQELEQFEVKSVQDIQRMNVLLDSAIQPLRTTIETAAVIPAIKELGRQYEAVKLAESGFESFEQLEVTLEGLHQESAQLRGRLGGLGRFLDRSDISNLDLQISQTEDLRMLIMRQQNSVTELTDRTGRSQDKLLEKLTTDVTRVTTDKIINRYDGFLQETRGTEGDQIIENGLAAQLNEEFIRRSLLTSTGGFTDQENMDRAVALVKESLDTPSTDAVSIASEDQMRLTRELRALPYELSSAAEFFVQRERPGAAPFQEMADFVVALPVISSRTTAENSYKDILSKLKIATGQSRTSYEMESVRRDFEKKMTELTSSNEAQTLETKIDEFINSMNSKRWEVFRESPEVQRLLGRDRIDATNSLLGNTITQRLMNHKEGTHGYETISTEELGHKLLSFVNAETLPIIILNAYREPGNHGTFPFLDGYSMSSDRVPLFKLIDGLTVDQLQALRDQNIPGAMQVVELIKNNPKTFRDKDIDGAENPINQQVMQGLGEMSLHYLQTGDEKTQCFIMGALKRVDADLGDGYASLSNILLESSNPKVQDAIIDCCVSRAEYDGDEKAITVLVQNYDNLKPELQGKIKDVVPSLFCGLVDKDQVDPENIENLSKVLGRNQQEFMQTISFIKDISEADRFFISYHPSGLNEYLDLANNPAMLPFIKKLIPYGYSFSPSHATALGELLRKQDVIIGQVENIRQDFPDFRYSLELTVGEPELLTDPYEIVISRNFPGVEGVIKGIEYLDKIPPEYTGKATEMLVRNASREVVGVPGEQTEKLITAVYDFLHSRDLGEAEIPIYHSLVETAGLIYTEPGLFYDSEDLEGGITVKRPIQFDEARLNAIISEGDPKKMFSSIYNFTDTYRYNLEDEYYEANVQFAHAERSSALKMLEDISDPRLKELATIRTFGYLLDPDLGDPDLARQLLSHVTDPELKTHLESVYAETRERLDRGDTKYGEFFRKVDIVSSINKEDLIKELKFEEGAQQERLEEELPRVQHTQHVSINIRYPNLLRVLRGDHRFKSSWETHSRGGVYDIERDFVEREMGTRAKGTRSDPHPVYGAAWSENGRDEKLGGAGGRYGESFVILKNDRIRSRTTFTYGDSFDNSQRLRMLTWNDASYAKSMMNITGGPYVEAQILGGVTTDDIESINVPVRGSSLEETAKFQDEISKLRQEFPNITINIM